MLPCLGTSVGLRVQPDLLLLDGLHDAGDTELRRQSAQAVHERVHAGTAAVLVSLDEDNTADLCGNVLCLEHGGRLRGGECAEVLAAYRAAVAKRQACVSRCAAARP